MRKPEPFKKFTIPILALPRWAKRFIVLVVDATLCVLTVWLAYYLRLGEFVALSGNALWAALISIVIALPIFFLSELYQAIFRFNGWRALMATTRAIALYGFIYASTFTVMGFQNVPRTVGIIQPILLLLLVGFSRSIARLWLGDHYQKILKKESRPKVLIYGAGKAGRQLAVALANSPEMKVLGYLDDDDRLHGHKLNDLSVFSPNDLPNLVSNLKISDVLLAMPSLSRQNLNVILNKVRPAKVSIRRLPSVTELALGKVSVADLRDLEVEDLLGREPVMPNFILLGMNVHSKVVMVTGSGGSIGSELCRQILALEPAKLLMIDQSEFALYKIHNEMVKRLASSEVGGGGKLVPLLASVQDKERMQEIMSTWRPNTVYHAAAYKHVPLVEHNPAEGIKNNVIGTLHTAQAAAETGVADFILISTDKAVRPTNIMGASKRISEMILQALATTSTRTKFSMVRFGNVLDSSGSVVPRFRQQIREGGPITLTDSNVTRYFMTITEASQLVIQAGAMAKGGEVFVLNMGQPVKILDLAYRLVELSGLKVKDEQNPDGDIEIKVTGLRPGEKLYEELLIGNDPKPTTHPRIMKANEDLLLWKELENQLKFLEIALGVNDVSVIRLIMTKLVPNFTPNAEIVDWVFMEQNAEADLFGL